jgi:hypothetical protein
MQVDWDRDGEEAFTILELEALPENASVVDKRVREIYWMQHYQNTLYNAHQVSFAPTKEAMRKGVAAAHKEPGNRWTEEVNRKRSEAQKGKPKGHGAKISATKQQHSFLRKLGLMR